MLNYILKGRVRRNFSSSLLLAHTSAKGFCPIFNHLCLADSSYKFTDLKDRGLPGLQIQNLLLPGSLFCHFPRLDSMIHTPETEHRFHCTEMFVVGVPLPADRSVCKTNTSMFLSRSCVYLKLSLLLWQQHVYLK